MNFSNVNKSGKFRRKLRAKKLKVCEGKLELKTNEVATFLLKMSLNFMCVQKIIFFISCIALWEQEKLEILLCLFCRLH